MTTLVHISDLSWTRRIKNPGEVLKKGDTVEAMILKIDAENQRLSLGLKQLGPNVWDDFFAHHKVGDTIVGRIVRLTDFGVFVEIAEGVEGLVHVRCGPRHPVVLSASVVRVAAPGGGCAPQHASTTERLRCRAD